MGVVETIAGEYRHVDHKTKLWRQSFLDELRRPMRKKLILRKATLTSTINKAFQQLRSL
jgi:hypothetical protein